MRAVRIDFANVEVSRHPLFRTRPPGADPFVIAQISDLHLHAVGRREERALEAIESARPDLIVLTGDAIDDPRKVPVLERFLSLLEPLAPRKIAILGNWEHFAEIEAAHIERNMERHGVELLCNRTLVLDAHGSPLAVTGFDDLVAGHPDPDRALSGLPERTPHLILAHCPAYRDVLVSHPAFAALDRSVPRVMLAGHTHGGQIRFGRWTPVLPTGSEEYVDGWYRSPALDLYINRGLGMSLVPVRIGARPEVTLLDLGGSHQESGSVFSSSAS